MTTNQSRCPKIKKNGSQCALVSGHEGKHLTEQQLASKNAFLAAVRADLDQLQRGRAISSEGWQCPHTIGPDGRCLIPQCRNYRYADDPAKGQAINDAIWKAGMEAAQETSRRTGLHPGRETFGQTVDRPLPPSPTSASSSEPVIATTAGSVDVNDEMARIENAATIFLLRYRGATLEPRSAGYLEMALEQYRLRDFDEAQTFMNEILGDAIAKWRAALEGPDEGMADLRFHVAALTLAAFMAYEHESRPRHS